MRVLLNYGNYKGEITDLPIPEIKADEVLVKICYCGICGTDQDLFSSKCSFAEDGLVSYPVRLGHEWSGVVEKVGCDVSQFKVGDKVVGDNSIACGVCAACQNKDFDNCEHRLNVGTIDPVYDGAFCEFYVVPARHLHKIPEGIPLKAACLAEPFSVAYGGIKRMNITDKSTVAIIGTGCIGLAASVLALCSSAKEVFIIGRNPQKLAAAQKIGATVINSGKCDAVAEIKRLTDGKGADFVLECSGAKGTYSQAMDIAAFRATVALIGFYSCKEDNVNVDTVVSKALSVFGVMGESDMMSGALSILEKHKPDILPIITDELEFDDCLKGFTRENYPNAIKIVVKICEEE